VLRERYRLRPFVEDELWAGKIRRARRRHPAGLTGEEMAGATGLDARQILRALAWQAARSGADVDPSGASGVG
jgi:hypothetical protein